MTPFYLYGRLIAVLEQGGRGHDDIQWLELYYPRGFFPWVGLTGPLQVNVRGKTRRVNNHAFDPEPNLFLLNFVTSDYAGPGRVEPGQPVQNMILNGEQFYAPETAMLFDPDTQILYLESSQSLGAGAIGEYFENFANAGVHYSLLAIMDDDAAARVRRHQTIRKITMTVQVRQPTVLDREAGLDVFQAVGTGIEATSFDLVFRVEGPRDRSLLVQRAQEFIENRLEAGPNETSITKMTVSGREHDDDSLEVIDLIQHREKYELRLEIDPDSRKVPHYERWAALVEIWREDQ